LAEFQCRKLRHVSKWGIPFFFQNEGEIWCWAYPIFGHSHCVLLDLFGSCLLIPCVFCCKNLQYPWKTAAISFGS
jgi:hypothetical protein